MGQVLILPIGQALIAAYGWVLALGGLVAIAFLIVPLAAALGPSERKSRKELKGQLISHALAEAGLHRGYWLLMAGFFVCGFHVTFIATHLPAYIVDSGLSPGLGATALALIGLFNIIGSSFWGIVGGKYSKKYSLSSLYFARAVLIAALVFFPVSNFSVLVFASGMGFLWLGTVPLTSGLIGQIFGVRYLSTLFGIVFFSHQIGAFLGVWMGGYIFDLTEVSTLFGIVFLSHQIGAFLWECGWVAISLMSPALTISSGMCLVPWESYPRCCTGPLMNNPLPDWHWPEKAAHRLKQTARDRPEGFPPSPPRNKGPQPEFSGSGVPGP